MTYAQHAEWFLRHQIVYPVLRTILRNTTVPLPLNVQTARRILLLRYDRLGDTIVTSPMIRRLKELNPKLEVGMLCSDRNVGGARMLSRLDHLHVISGGVWQTFRTLFDIRRQNYDIVINLVFNRTTTGGLLANVAAPKSIKIGQGDPKYAFYYNAQVSLPREIPMVAILSRYGELIFGGAFGGSDLRYELDEGSEARQRVDAFLRTLPASPAVVNLSAGERVRVPTLEQMLAVVRHLRMAHGCPVVLICSNDDLATRDTILRECGDSHVMSYPKQGISPFADIVALSRRALIVITPDTSIVHVACATQTPLVGLYTSQMVMAEWVPVGTPHELVVGTGGDLVADIPVSAICTAIDKSIARTSKEAHA